MPLFRKRQPDDDADPTKVGGVIVRPHLSESELAPGTEVASYRVAGVLGRGGMGVVYRAEHQHLGRAVALKLLAPGLAGDFRERFVRESRVAASLSHPNIVTVYDAGEAEGMLWIAMQLVDGTDLRRLLIDEGPLPGEDVVRVAGQVASALDAAHAAGLIHRDVKPGNILLEHGHAWLTDFGLTKRLATRSDLTARNDIVGTPDYLAPEQIDGTRADGRVDQYALGCVIHHALAGAPPFARDSDIAVLQAHLTDQPPRLSELRADVPAEVDEVLGRALAKNPEERFATATEFTNALAVALGAARASAERAHSSSGVVLVGIAEPSTRAVVRAALARGSVEIAEVGDAEALLAAAAHARPSLVIVETSLPGLDMAETLRDLRGRAEGRVPVVALAERGRDDEWRAAIAAGADDVLLRPFSAFQLLAKVRDHMPKALER